MKPWPPMPADLSLGDQAAHLFLVITAALPPAALSHFESLLSAEETARIHRLRIPGKRREAIAARGTLRTLLGHFLAQPPRDVLISQSPQGKPFVPGLPLHFNVSHTALKNAPDTARILIAIARHHALGVDIEAIDSTIACDELAARFFSPTESAAIAALPPEARIPAFFRCWTRKEALLKATGQGIATGLTHLEVPIERADHPLPMGPWRLHDIPIGPSHAAALATPALAPLNLWAYEVSI